jgi:hypothetical protein
MRIGYYIICTKVKREKKEFDVRGEDLGHSQKVNEDTISRVGDM